MVLLKIVSGGQTGIDRLALDLAIELGFEHGGWCPAGRRAEDGVIPDRYQLCPTDSRNYAVRTEENICHSDATMIFHSGKISGGTELTIKLAKKHNKPLLVFDQSQLLAPLISAAELGLQWLLDNQVKSLNVAGPRQSSSPELPGQVYPFLKSLLLRYSSEMLQRANR